jgi:Caspase domain/Domain of unknown function (DUF4384)
MSQIKRRRFMQFAGSALAALGLSQLEFEQQAIRYAQVLAQNTPRKRALLVGINNYRSSKWNKQNLILRGAVNDVKLQKELLVYRFGFNSSDIRILTEKDATRENILKAFEEHLIKWAKPGDVVLFHFSGHGSRIADPDKIFDDGLVSTIVPVDSDLPKDYPNKGGVINDISGHTLWLLMQSTNTENITFVLDCCYSGGARNGIITVRSRPGDEELLRSPNGAEKLLPTQQEQDYQKQLMSRLKITGKDLALRRKQGIPKGVMLAAAQQYQESHDVPIGGGYNGIFTYQLTRCLWQQSGSESFVRLMSSVSQNTMEFMKDRRLFQKPDWNTKKGSENLLQKPVYFSSAKNIPAEGVLTKVRGGKVDLFLGGINPQSLEAFGRGAILALVDNQGRDQGFVQVESRQELTAEANLFNAGSKGNITPGIFVQERSRAIPNDLSLKIGLDSASLTPEDIQESKSALAGIKRIIAEPLQDQEVQYILGRMTPTYYQQLQKLGVKEIPAVGSIVLFSPGLVPIPGAVGAKDQKIRDVIVKQFQAKLKSLLAARIVKLMLNTESSKLNVAVAMQTMNNSQIVAESFTVRGGTIRTPNTTRGAKPLNTNTQKLSPGTQVQFLVQNSETVDLYISVLLINSDGELSVLSPLPGNENIPPVKAGEEIRIPDRSRGERYKFIIEDTLGTAEVLIIATLKPLTNAINFLRNLAAQNGTQRGASVDLNQEPVEAISSLLQDLNEPSRGIGYPLITDVSNIDSTKMAALSISFDVG